MKPIPFVLAASLMVMAPVAAARAHASPQERGGGLSVADGGKPAPAARPGQGERQAVARAVARPVGRPAEPRALVTARAGEPQRQVAEQRRTDGGRDRGNNPQSGGAVDRGSRPRGDNPSTGRAVPRERPRESGPAPARPSQERRGGRNIYVAPPVHNYYYYPRRYYPYGYSAFGLGYFYYDPYTWYPPNYYGSYYGGAYGGGPYDNYYDGGEVRLAVSPRDADVYVDGYFAGRVDEFDGVFQALKIESGAHHIQIVSPGYQPLDFDVRVNPGQKITYRGDLRR